MSFKAVYLLSLALLFSNVSLAESVFEPKSRKSKFYISTNNKNINLNDFSEMNIVKQRAVKNLPQDKIKYFFNKHFPKLNTKYDFGDKKILFDSIYFMNFKKVELKYKFITRSQYGKIKDEISLHYR